MPKVGSGLVEGHTQFYVIWG
ncbi:Protein of unknown function [Pyronema omphalodes CBS 100304]|uniref:Uncharacterized protein n=1 Tax=Pyronema omphalodes (strain CBS 100304) TaxID=1076935 RepID=U4LIS5_PYROM|nr:Protein of unknown function [Pyronema omphalodes CBS 100304]